MQTNDGIISHFQGLKALSPLMLFLGIYLSASLAGGDFYSVPISVVFVIACVYALCIAKGSLAKRVSMFTKGATHSNVLLMIWIFILSGIFAATAKDIGAVDATVDAARSIMPPSMMLAGFFITACLISMAIGTSVGTIAALVPIASGIAGECGFDTGMLIALVVGGAFFGDNLSFISDTTIAATRIMGCKMRDKFKANLAIIAPAAVIVTVIYVFIGRAQSIEAPVVEVQWLKLLPYLSIIVLALCGINVSMVLGTGIALNAIIGLSTGSFNFAGWLASAGRGISGMTELITVTLLASGLLELIRRGGGMDYIIQHLSARVNGRRKAQLCMAALVCLANICTANNTIAILTVGPIARDIADKFGIDRRRAASILDTFSCFVQGIIPYGAQILMAASLSGCAALEIIPHLYYPFLIGISATIAILLNIPRPKASK